MFIPSGPKFPKRDKKKKKKPEVLKATETPQTGGLSGAQVAWAVAIRSWVFIRPECSLPNVLSPHTFRYFAVHFHRKWGLCEMCVWPSSRNAHDRKLESDQAPSASLHSISAHYSCAVNTAIWSRKRAFRKIETKWPCSNICPSKDYGKRESVHLWDGASALSLW